MEVIDVQIHEPDPQLNWPVADDATRFRLMTEIVLAGMDAAGVDAAVISNATTDLGWNSFAVSHFPGRFAATPGCSPGAPDGAERLAALAATEGVIGIRISLGTDCDSALERLESGEYDPFFLAAQRFELPLFVYPGKPYPDGFLRLVAATAGRFPEVKLAPDHVGVPQPPVDVEDTPPFKRLPDLLDLARYPNVAIKLTSAPTLSREPYPFDDLWEPLLQIVHAFGAERVMWGSDIQRVTGRIAGPLTLYPERQTEDSRVIREHLGPLYARWERARSEYVGKHTYAEAVGYVRDTNRLSEEDKALILGGSLRRWLRWPKEGRYG